MSVKQLPAGSFVNEPSYLEQMRLSVKEEEEKKKKRRLSDA